MEEEKGLSLGCDKGMQGGDDEASEGIGYLIPSKGIATLELERVSELVKHEIKSLRASLFLRALLQRFVHV